MMEINEIKEYLPHRYPFLLIDRVLELHLGERILGCKNVTIGEPFFEGHFPSQPVMPGVLIVEAMAQAAGILGFRTMDKKPSEGSMYLFAGADNLRFKRAVIPGDQLLLSATIISSRRSLWKFDCEARVGDDLAAAGTILCADRKTEQ